MSSRIGGAFGAEKGAPEGGGARRAVVTPGAEVRVARDACRASAEPRPGMLPLAQMDLMKDVGCGSRPKKRLKSGRLGAISQPSLRTRARGTGTPVITREREDHMRLYAAKTLVTAGVMVLPGGMALAAYAPDLLAFLLFGLRRRFAS